MSQYHPNPGMHKIGKSFEYRAICDSCGLKVWNWELRLRWDGLWCCSDDWEVRHPLDFYRTRNDTHKLPFIRSDGNVADPQLTWTAGTTGIIYTAVGNETMAGDTLGYYTLNPLDLGPQGTWTGGSTSGVWRLARSTYPSFSDSTIKLDTPNPLSTTTATSGATINLPTTPTFQGTWDLKNDKGQVIIQNGNVAAGSAHTGSAGGWTHKQGNLFYSFYYGT